MQIKQNNGQHQIKVRDHPLQRSSSVGGIIHGDLTKNKSNHYIDSLERFQRDFATVDKNQRQQKLKLKKQSYDRRRNLIIERQNNIKQHQEQNLIKMRQRQYHSQMLHALGAKRTAHTQSIPVNPINLKYEQNYRGRYQKHKDQQRKINQLVRTHNLQTQGTSGYNIITGRASNHVQNLLLPDTHQIFQQKLSQFYSKFKIGPGIN